MEAWKTPVIPPRVTKKIAPRESNMGIFNFTAPFLMVNIRLNIIPSKGIEMAMVVKEKKVLTV